MRVRVTSGAEGATRRAELEFSFLSWTLEGLAQFHAEYLREIDEYQDRTGELRRHTVGRLVERSRDRIVIELVMDKEYASYLARGHKELAHFFEVVQELSRNAHEAIAAIGKRISGSQGGGGAAWETRQRGGTGIGRGL